MSRPLHARTRVGVVPAVPVNSLYLRKKKKRRNKKVSVRGYRVLQRPAVYGKFSPTRHQSSLCDAQSFRGNIMTCIVAPRDSRSVD